MEVVASDVPFSYSTVKVTQSRIDKGLLAVPVSLMELFPKSSGRVLLMSEDGEWVRRSFTAYDSSSGECRIGGMREFYGKYHVRSGDELVVQVYGDGRYRILPESVYRQGIRNLESALDRAQSETAAEAAIAGIAQLTNTTPDDVLGGEYVRLAEKEAVQRRVNTRTQVKAREHIPPSLRKLLVGLYRGRCQVSGFSFLKKDGEPYFEVHHIDPLLGNHPKNVLVVSPNVHAQFTYAAVEHLVDESGWLRHVGFNGDHHSVFQVADQLPLGYEKEVHSM